MPSIMLQIANRKQLITGITREWPQLANSMWTLCFYSNDSQQLWSMWMLLWVSPPPSHLKDQCQMPGCDIHFWRIGNLNISWINISKFVMRESLNCSSLNWLASITDWMDMNFEIMCFEVLWNEAPMCSHKNYKNKHEDGKRQNVVTKNVYRFIYEM